ncbi:hypothetical protein BDP55DRAFT_545763 [Colletotrichum godetiae]|uniref:Uncharacterized protein n=1 Tax=Colletotrichum godetiae TaxID=1209918 RepID=A0AAJ0EZ48_9PEZI|nr:uncharacterized protein BDP55DRAFT_545763 [Colletotrichum godetiae]KAK1689336.1 hypothetical protein BDP55DRAFT_545763 [Colletotrichum godetiae]
MSSLGLPGPFNIPPGDANLNRNWNAFLDKHNLRNIWQTTRADINNLCNTALLALQISRSQQIAIEDSILDLWDRIGLTVDYLNPDANPLWRADEQLVKPTALRLQEQRRRLQVQMNMCQNEVHWDQVWLELDMSSNPPTALSRGGSPSPVVSDEDKTLDEDPGLNMQETGEAEGRESNILRVAKSLSCTRYFLGHAAGDPIFSYDGRDFDYRGRVPRDPKEDVLRLQILLPKVLAQLVTLIAFSPSLEFPEECVEMLNCVDNSSDELILRVCFSWILKFGEGLPATYAYFLGTSPVIQEFAWLAWDICTDANKLWSRDTTRDRTSLMRSLAPIMELLSFDRTPVLASPGLVLRNFAELHEAEEEREAKELVFEQKEYDVALVYDASICESIKSLYSTYTGRHHPDVGVLFLRIAPPQFLLDNNDNVFANGPIPDEVIAAHHRIKLRLLDDPEPEAERSPVVDHRTVSADDIQPEIVVSGFTRRRHRQQQRTERNETPAEPPLKRRRGRHPKHRPTPPTSDPVAD